MKASLSWDTIGPFLVWQFLIPLAAGWLQTILYAVFIRAGDPKPAPGTARFVRHRRYILIATYLVYFAFTLYEADYHLQQRSTAYHDLGVPLTVDEAGIQSRFRKLTVRFHPDKVRSTASAAAREHATAYYVHLKHARDVLLDPARRFAYDRFGPDVLQSCTSCATVRDFTDHALLTAAGTYGMLLVVLLGANALGFLKDGAYWRYLAVVAVAAFDLRTAMRPDHPPVLTRWLNPLVAATRLRPAYLPFQLVAVAKKAAVSAAQFLGLLIPLYRDDPLKPAKPAADDSEDARHSQIDRLDAVVRNSNLDVTRLLELESIPFREKERAKVELREAMRMYMVQNVVHQEKEVRNAIGQSIGRRRVGVPHGAVGTR